jgi:serine/threonine-protein kinase
MEPPPRQIGPFRVLRRLGRGGMADVFLAVAHGASGFERRVAVKTLLPALQGDATYERILIDEARLAARFHHRNLVQVHDLGVANGTYWVRMDLVEGTDLAALLTDAPLPAALALYVAEEVASALAYLHALRGDDGLSLGLVHRDVSPANVLLSRDGAVRLGDFGIARSTLRAEVTQGGVRKGKYAYMSPEQVVGGAVTAASDRFSLGVTLYEMLTGRRPYDGESVLEVMERVREAAPPPLDALDADVADLLRACLARDPAARFVDTASLVAALGDARQRRPRADAMTLAARVP